MSVEFSTGPDGTEHIYTVDGREVPCVSDVVEIVCGPANYQNGYEIDEAIMDAAAEKGTLIHDALALADDDDLDWEATDPGIAGYCEAWEEWVVHSDFVPDKIETPIYSAELDVAGTPDVTGWVGNEAKLKVVVDRKSGSGGIQWRHSIQMAGYRLIEETVDLLIIVQLVPKQKRKKWREHIIPAEDWAWNEQLFKEGRDILTARTINGK
jgi:hypothetical protein